MSKVQLLARVVKQDDRTFYQTALPAADLLNDELFQVDRWNNTTQRGYQREVNEPHSRRIAQYIKGKTALTNALPTNVVVNVRGNLDVAPTTIPDIVHITISDNHPGYIIDGQHRIKSFEKVNADNETTLENYEVGVTVMNVPIEEEMVQFKNLNSTANRPAKGLGQVIGHQLYKMTGEAPVTFTEQAVNSAVAMTIKLSTDVESPFHGKIAIGGIRKRNFHTTVQSSMVNALLPLFLNGRFSDPSMSAEKQYQYILEFWKAVDATWPEAIANPDSSTIMRTTGITPLTKVLSKIFNNLNLTPTEEDFEDILTDIKRNLVVTDDDWALSPRAKLNGIRAGYSLNKGNTLVADYLWTGVSTKKHSKV